MHALIRRPCWREAVPKVRIVADYSTPGYQLACEEARGFGGLPVSAELLNRLARWNDGYERCDPRDYEDVCGMRFDFLAFATEGLEIAKAVKRIAQAEKAAVAEVRARAVEVAIEATRRLLAERLTPKQSDSLIDSAIAELPKKLH